jgi:NAD(P)-dependent dehydrogenase (short-subunit alcohol dehydrogenase family)
MNRLEDKIVVVTGAAGTIGREVARQVLEEGALLAATDLPGEALEGLEGLLKATGGKYLVLAADSADASSFASFLERVTATFGSVDVLVNVAGYWEIVDFLESTSEHWTQMLRANLLTAMTSCQAVLPSMLERKDGTIVNFASTAGEYGSIRPSAAYAAAKGGVIAFTKSLAREVSPEGVRVNSISPGPIDTPMLQAASAEQRAIAASRTLLGRLGQPIDIARAVLYLASSESSFVTGEVLRVNGGSLI